MTWLLKAVCTNDPYSYSWVSYNIKHIEYAKQGCANCPVKKECIQNAVQEDDEPVGVIAGLSEFDRLMMRWQKVSDLNGSNWD